MQGTKVVEAPTELLARLLASPERVVIDVGTGDGRWPYELARSDPDSLYIGIDPDAAAMSEYAFRASRKPARGGVENVLFVVASLEQLPPELMGSAGLVRINFPWAGLLRGLLRPEREALSAVSSLMSPNGDLEIVLSYDPERDMAALEGETLGPLDETYIESILGPAYLDEGIAFEEVRRLTPEEALAIPATWGRRLLHGRSRDVFFIRARRI